LKKLYVGNLSWSVTEDDVRDLFSTVCDTRSVKLITDRETGRSRGFAFVELDDDDSASAISALNGQDLQGRQLRISEAEDRKPREGGGRY
jgi:RNA recognition motif-containing protein